MRHGLALVTAFAVATPALAAPPPTMPNPFNDRLQRLSPVDRAGALRRAITDANGRCGRLDFNAYRGPWGNLRFWQAHCQPGGDYGVFLGPDGEVQVRTCAEMIGQALPQCEARPKA